jgi:hypothetical protein
VFFLLPLGQDLGVFCSSLKCKNWKISSRACVCIPWLAYLRTVSGNILRFILPCPENWSLKKKCKLRAILSLDFKWLWQPSCSNHMKTRSDHFSSKLQCFIQNKIQNTYNLYTYRTVYANGPLESP